MISIINISPEGTKDFGLHKYALRINKYIITEFEHQRTPKGLAQCLRDAADAVDKLEDEKLTAFIKMLSDFDYNEPK